MKRKIFRILGKKGRITIPYDIRNSIGFKYNDLLSFAEEKDSDTVIIKRELIGKGEKIELGEEKENYDGLIEFLDTLSLEQKKAALLHLAKNTIFKPWGEDDVRV